MQNKREKGFTLLEILLVIAAIGILAAIVLIAINPNRQLAQARNAIRQTDINTIQKAIDQQALDNTPGGVYLSTITNLTAPTEICGPAGGCGGSYIDLSSLVPTYIAAIPRDPQAISPGSGYKVFINPNNNKIAVTAGLAENSKVIANNPAPWTPASLGSALSFWADANDESTLTLNNQAAAQTVSQWNDRSGNIRHLTQGTAAQQPILVRGVRNLLRYTQEFDNAYWTKFGSTITPNTTIAPDGTMTADTFTATGTNAYIGDNVSVAANTTYTASYYVKKNNARWTNGQAWNGVTGFRYWFDLDLGVVGSVQSIGDTSGWVNLGSTITSVGSGWYRASISFTTNASTTFLGFLAPAHIAVTGDGAISSTIGQSNYIWGAMLNTGATPNEYIGRNALATDGTDDTMGTASFVLAQPFSRFSVITRRNGTAGSQHVLNSSASSPNTALWQGGITSADMWAGGGFSSAQTFSNGQSSQFGEIYNGGSSSIFNNGTGTNGNAGSQGTDGFRFGGWNGGNYSRNDIHSALILNRLPTTDERQRIEGYLAWRYGIQANLPSGHPFISSVPIWQ